MPRRATKPCVGCGRPVERIVRCDRTWVCIGCAEDRVAKNARDISLKRGPGYRRWRAGMLVWTKALHDGTEERRFILPKEHGGDPA